MNARLPKLPFNGLPYWLLIAACVFTFSISRARAGDQGQPRTADSLKATGPKLPDQITTLDGKTYDKVLLEKVEPDGLSISFTPSQGGSGSAKLKFRNLPPELRERFGYDAARAADYETARAQGEATWLAQSAIRGEQRWAVLAEQAARERQLRAEAEAAEAEAERARAETANNWQEPTSYYSGWGWPYTYGRIPHFRGGSHPNQNHTHHQITAPGITASPTSPFMGPMRPTGR